MITLDWIILIIAAIIIFLQTYRGAKDMDLVLFEMCAFFIAAKISWQWYGKISSALLLNPGLVLLLLFILSSIILLLIVGILVKYAQFSLAPIDAWLSFIFGFVSSWIIIFVLLQCLLLAYPTGRPATIPLISSRTPVHETIQKSEISSQILYFKAFKSVGNFLNDLKLAQ